MICDPDQQRVSQCVTRQRGVGFEQKHLLLGHLLAGLWMLPAHLGTTGIKLPRAGGRHRCAVLRTQAGLQMHLAAHAHRQSFLNSATQRRASTQRCDGAGTPWQSIWADAGASALPSATMSWLKQITTWRTLRTSPCGLKLVTLAVKTGWVFMFSGNSSGVATH